MKLKSNPRRSSKSRITSTHRRSSIARTLRAEKLDERALLAADFGLGASVLAMDVNADGSISASDALSVINEIGQNDNQPRAGETRSSLRDTNRDGSVTSIDALLVINHLSRHGSGTIGLHEIIGQRGNWISDAQKDNIRQLMTDLNAIRADSEITPEQIEQLMSDLVTMLSEATRPSEESVSQLIENARSAAEDGELTATEIVGLTSDVHAVLASANISTEDAQAVAESVRAIAEASGVEQEDVQTILSDLQAIFAEFQNRDLFVSETQRDNIRNLVTDIATIRSESEVTRGQIEQLRSSLSALVEDATRPDRSLMLQLVRDARAAMSDGEISVDEREQLAIGVDAVLESANISEAERDAVIANLESIIDASGISPEDVQVLVEDLVAIRTEFLDNHQRLRNRFHRFTR